MKCREAVEEYLSNNPDAWDTHESGKAVARSIAARYGMKYESVYRAMQRKFDKIPPTDKDQSDQSDQSDQPGQQAPPVEAKGMTTIDSRSFYNEEDDTYIFWLPCRKGATDIVEGEYIREAARRYSRWEESGKEETINEICTAFGWPRQVFIEMKRELGRTHDMDPFTAEEHLEYIEGERDLVKDLVMMSRAKLERENKKRKWQETIDDAKRWRQLKRNKLDPFFKLVNDNPPKPETHTRSVKPLDDAKRILVINPADIHVGKLAYKLGQKETLDVVYRCCEDILWRANHLEVDKVVLITGNDLFHVDNMQKATTSGTPQNLQGSVHEMVGQGYLVVRNIIDLIREFGYSVQAHVVRSNHDEYGCSHLGFALQHMYRHIDEVKVQHTHRSRQYLRWGSNLFGMCHGHNEKMKDLGTLMANEAPDLWGICPFKYWFTGHLHYVKDQRVSEHGGHGVHIFQAPSPSVTDKWHDDNGYVLARRAVAAYTFHRKYGHEDRLIANVEVPE